MPPRAAMKSKGPYHHGDLRRTLVETAEALIVRDGPAALGLREVARLAGVSQAAPYRHFADKEALLAGVLEKGFDELAEAMAAARRAHREPLEALRAVGLSYVHFAAKRPSIFRLMFGPNLQKAEHPTLQTTARRSFDQLVEAVTVCARAGLLRRANPEAVVLAGWSLCHGLASLHADGALSGVVSKPTSKASIERTADALIDLLFDGAVATRRSKGR